MYQTTVGVDGMMCGMCEAHVNDAVRKAFPVKKVTSSHSKGQTVILRAGARRAGCPRRHRRDRLHRDLVCVRTPREKGVFLLFTQMKISFVFFGVFRLFS